MDGTWTKEMTAKDVAMPNVTISWMNSQNGKRLMIADEYKFYVHHTAKNGMKTWRCVVKSCRSKVYTRAGDAVMHEKSVFVHNHAKNSSLARQIVNNSIKLKLKLADVNVNQSPSKILRTELRGSDIERNLSNTDVSLVRRNLYNARKAIRAPPPTPGGVMSIYSGLDLVNIKSKTINNQSLHPPNDTSPMCGELNVRPTASDVASEADAWSSVKSEPRDEEGSCSTPLLHDAQTVFIKCEVSPDVVIAAAAGWSDDEAEEPQLDDQHCDNASRTFRGHRKVASSEKPFSCTVCNKCFCRRGDLQRHARLHTNEDVYGCAVCAKTFLQLHLLQNHMRLHADDI